MLDVILSIGVAISLGFGGYGIYIAVGAKKSAAELETLLRTAADSLGGLDAKVTDLQSILTAAPPDMIDASIIASSWKREMESLPEGSPRRQAFAARLRQLGSS